MTQLHHREGESRIGRQHWIWRKILIGVLKLAERKID
jgi:hypothetical protein